MRKDRTGWTWTLLTAGVLTVSACAEESAEEAAPPAAEESGAAEAEPALDDAAIAHIAVTANAIDADMGDVALARSTNEEVRAFAETMVRDHRGVNEQAVALATRLGVTPADNDVSRGLASDAATVKAQLEALAGAAFDRAYMEREVAYHAAVLDALDTTLIPGATNGELRSLLETARGAVAAHLEHARALSASLAASAG